MSTCEGLYVSGHRQGQPCPYRASALINFRDLPPGRVCGYHSRAYSPSIVYPLDWYLARIRQWQRGNLDRLLGAAR